MNKLYTIAYRTRGILMAPPYLILVMVFVGETERDSLVWPAGLLLFGIGLLIRIWAQMHLHYRLRIRKTLTTTGPYAYIRNPIYVANTALLLGLTVMSELLWFFPVMLLWCLLVYNLVVRREEAHLSDKYGQSYIAYTRRTPRWFPRIGRVRDHRRTGRGIDRFLWPSVAAELHCLLLLFPLVGKEVFSVLPF